VYLPLLTTVEQSIKGTLREVQFQASKVDSWTSTIIEQVLKGLQNLNKPFKFISAWQQVVFTLLILS